MEPIEIVFGILLGLVIAMVTVCLLMLLSLAVTSILDEVGIDWRRMVQDWARERGVPLKEKSDW